MRLTNSEESYGLIHQSLHWATALLILSLLPMGVYMHDLPIDNVEQVNDKVWLYSLHKTLGMAALLVAILRIIWARTQPHPRPLHGGMEGFAASTVHNLLYIAIIAMPVMGWLHHAAAEGFAPIWWPFSQNLPFIPKSVELSQFFKVAHFITGVVLVGSLFLHIAGAVKHTIIDKDKTLARMVPGAYQETGTPPAPQNKSALPLATAGLAVVIAIAAVFVVNNIYYQTGTNGSSSALQESAANSDGAWVINYETSALEISVDQLGTPIKGQFSDWSADVIFDPENPEASSINATVGVASLRLGEVSDRAISAEFLNAELNPQATFVSENVAKTDAGYAAQGALTIAGVSQDFVLNFSFEEIDGQAKVVATGSLQRLDFGVGKDFQDDSSVGRIIGLNITIDAARP